MATANQQRNNLPAEVCYHLRQLKVCPKEMNNEVMPFSEEAVQFCIYVRSGSGAKPE